MRPPAPPIFPSVLLTILALIPLPGRENSPNSVQRGSTISTCHGLSRAVSELALRGSLQDAIRLSQDALEAHPNDSYLLNNLGCILMFALSEASWSRAEDLFRRSLQSDALNSAAMYNYAMLLSSRPHYHRHNKMCTARQLLRGAFQMNSDLPSAVLTARDILLEKSNSHTDESDSDDFLNSISTVSIRSSEQDSFESSLDDQSGGETVTFGVKSKAHARSLSTLVQGVSLGGRRRGQQAGGAKGCRKLDESNTSGETRKERKSKQIRTREDALARSCTCITAVKAGEAAALVFCTSLSNNKVFVVFVKECA